MARAYQPPVKLTPKFKYGDQVVFHNDFYGRLIGTVEAVAEQETGFLWWKKYQLVYQVAAETDASWLTIYCEENLLKPYAIPKPVK